MVYDYTIKHDGILYPAGTDVPVGNVPKIEEKIAEPAKVEEKPKAKKTAIKKKK